MNSRAQSDDFSHLTPRESQELFNDRFEADVYSAFADDAVIWGYQGQEAEMCDSFSKTTAKAVRACKHVCDKDRVLADMRCALNVAVFSSRLPH